MQAHLLIDGYNVILGLPHLEKIFQRDKERAGDELDRIARNIHDADAVRVAIVMGPEKFLSWADTRASEKGAWAARTRSVEDDGFGTDLGSLLL